MLEENLKTIHKRIEDACKKANRDVNDVTLICVSKTKPLSDIKEIYDLGERDFGENKVQELTKKMPEMPEDTKWHMIGHLQRNKVKYLINHVKLIHSVDSYRLAEEINIQSKKKGIVTPILIEVNIGNEDSKYGVKYEETKTLISEISTLDGVTVQGLMTVAPYVEKNEENRPLFRKMYDLFIDIKNENIDNVNMNVLSMGMTNDFEIAIEEGATMVRVGTGIFGARDYSK
ncbi:MAG: YggS family pyridoxal phosphate-dependent enzyme [Lachnospiraceae bacterium]|nr:YggS family pyridoxal phosphate-dependent enzyme [Lachnospiraceae bacterium]